jgi:hypothetical protein
MATLCAATALTLDSTENKGPVCRIRGLTLYLIENKLDMRNPRDFIENKGHFNPEN